MSTYRRKTGWVPQSEREFTLTDDRPDTIDVDKLAELILVMVFTSDDDSPPDGRMIARLGHPPTR